MKKVTVDWFEIPVSDMDRAIFFYQKVFGCNLHKVDMGDFQMAMFPGEGGGAGAGGSLVSIRIFINQVI